MLRRGTIAIVVVFGFSLAAVGSFTTRVVTDGSRQPACPEPAPTVESRPGAKKDMAQYKGVTLGMAADALRAKLGGPKDKSDAMDLYVFSESEIAQFYYDSKQAVQAIMITYSGDLKTAPTAADIFGAEVPAKEDGSISKMERFPKDGFWISYNRTAGKDAIVNIAMQRIQ